ncbi:MAG: SDR family NAD(P)-dependent oxidoreductase [Burkholderiaceae bacterium]
MGSHQPPEESIHLITGAAGGIGVPTVRALAAKDQAMHLIDLNAQALETLVSESNARATWHASDLDGLDACRTALPPGQQPIGSIIHLAGIFVPHQLDDAGREVYSRTIQANATNAYDIVSAALPRLSENARIIFVSSLAFNRGAADHVAYSMAKGALVGLTRSLSRALGPRGILVNALAPGIIETSMPAHVIKTRGAAAKSATALGRFGQPEEVSGVIEFLLSPAASYITGQLINIDGGAVNG